MSSNSESQASGQADRRDFLSVGTSLAMVGGLAAGYGSFAAVAGRFLYPTAANNLRWQFVTTLDRLRLGQALDYTAPGGAKIVVARQGEGSTAEDFIALSSVCPHLGCQVHWEGHRDRFFCPCHNGVFDRQGKPQSGPPAAANQQLMRFPLKVAGNLLLIEVPLNGLATADEEQSS